VNEKYCYDTEILSDDDIVQYYPPGQ